MRADVLALGGILELPDKLSVAGLLVEPEGDRACGVGRVCRGGTGDVRFRSPSPSQCAKFQWQRMTGWPPYRDPSLKPSQVPYSPECHIFGHAADLYRR